jgi:serine/threonine-protein kinase
VKILDFGLAKVMQSHRSEHTASNLMFGTSAYMSPEQCRSARDVGPATDVYALGCVAYELLFARLPFTYDNMAELVAAHLREVPPTPASLHPSIDAVLGALLSGMLAKDPGERPTLAHARHVIANALAKANRNVQQTVARPEPLALPAQPASIAVTPRPFRRVFATVAGLVILAVIIAAAVGGSAPGNLDRPRDTVESNSAATVDITVVPIESSPPNAARTEGVPAVVSGTVPEFLPAPRLVTNTEQPRANIERRPPAIRRVAQRATPQIKSPKRPDVVRDSKPRDENVQPEGVATAKREHDDAPASKKLSSRYETLNPFKKK